MSFAALSVICSSMARQPTWQRTPAVWRHNVVTSDTCVVSTWVCPPHDVMCLCLWVRADVCRLLTACSGVCGSSCQQDKVTSDNCNCFLLPPSVSPPIRGGTRWTVVHLHVWWYQLSVFKKCFSKVIKQVSFSNLSHFNTKGHSSAVIELPWQITHCD